MTNSVIVTGCDANYFELLKGLVISIRRTQPQPQDVVVLDCGLDESHRNWLAERDVRTVEPGWDIPVEGIGDWFKSMVARPHLPRWVPGYDTYIWMDADAWVQDWESIDVLLAAAGECGVAVVPSVDRAYPLTTGVRPENHTMLETAFDYQYREALFGTKLARRLTPYPGLLSGVFAARADSTLWTHWPERMRTAVRRALRQAVPAEAVSDRSAGAGEGASASTGAFQPKWRGHDDPTIFFTDQISFNVALYVDIVHFARLPAWCNWCCHKSYPMISTRGELLEPEYPYRRIGIIHLAADTKEGTFELQVQGGGEKTTSLRCPWDDESPLV